MSEIKTITVGGTTYNIGGGLLPHLMIYTDTDMTVTVTKGTTIITAEETSEGVYECDVPEYGTYTVSDTENTLDVIVDTVTIYQITMTPLVPEGATATPTDDIETWIKCAGIENTNEYSTLAEVLEDTALFDTLLRDSNACDYMARSTTWALAEGLVPVLTSDIASNGECVASYEDNSHPIWHAFDDNSSTKYVYSNPSANDNVWIGYHFTTPKVISRVNYIGNVDSPLLLPTKVQLQASNDGVNWISLSEEIAYSNADANEHMIVIENTTPYSYYSLKCSTRVYQNNYYVQFSKIQFFEADITQNEDAMRRVGKYDYCSSMLLTNSTWAEAIAESPYWDSVLEGLVPKMTSNTTPSGIVSASSTYGSGFEAYRVFDNDNSTKWSASTSANETLTYEFPNAIKICKAYIKADVYNSNCRLKNFEIRSSNDSSFSTYNQEYQGIIPSSGELVFNITPSNIAKYWRIYCIDNYSSVNTIAISTVQFYGVEEPETNIIHSAPNDTIYMIEDGSPVILATTNSDGIGELDWSDFEAGTYTLYSSVAKDPLNLSNDYGKNIVVTKTEYGGTTDAYLMPDAVKTLYWYGYMSDNCEEISTANGWTHGSYTMVSPTYNQNYVYMNGASSKLSGIGSKNKVTLTKLYTIAKVTTNQMYLAIYTQKNPSATYGDGYTTLSSTSIAKSEATPIFGLEDYICIQVSNGRAGNVYALWYE